jgi:hypothetical protein
VLCAGPEVYANGIWYGGDDYGDHDRAFVSAGGYVDDGWGG